MAKVNLDLLTEEDYQAFQEKRYADLSEDAKRYLSGEGFGSAATFMEEAGRGFSSSLRGLAGMLPENDFISVDQEVDLDQERRSRMMLETNPVAGWAGLLVGSAADPVTLPAAILKPLKAGGAALTGALRGSAGGALGGALDPVYEEFDDSKVLNVVAGAGLGAGLGAAVGKLLGRGTQATKAEADADEIISSPNMAKAVDDVSVTEESSVAKMMEPTIPDAATFNPTSGRFEVSEEVIPTADLTLPRQLAGAKPRFNKFETQFENDLDKAFYIVGNSTSKSAQHDAYVDWLKGRTGLDEAEVKAAAKAARSELARKLGSAPVQGDKLILAEPSTVAQTVTARATAPQQVAKPVTPTVTVKDGLDETDLALLRRAGVNVTVGRNGTVVVQDLLAPGRPMMSNATFLQRMEAAGIGIDLPAYRQRTKADVQARQSQEAEAMGRGAGDQPQVTNESQQFWTGQQPVNKEQWTTPPAGRAEQAPQMEGLQTGAPREGDAAGATRARPASVYGEQLAPGLVDMSPTELVARASSISPDEIIKMMPPSVRAAEEAKHPTGLAEYLSAGQKRLKKILADNNNIVEWMISKSRAKRGMSEEEVGAFAPFYHQAMAAREQTLAKAAQFRKEGGSFESAEGMKLTQDLMYYTGIALFKKNEGSKAGRALNAFRLISEKARKGQNLNNIFPGVVC
jgi:hypothetical protein